MRNKIMQIIENFENGLLSAGINADNIDYDVLANVRKECWDELEKLTQVVK
jgi:hypothetical protein